MIVSEGLARRMRAKRTQPGEPVGTDQEGVARILIVASDAGLVRALRSTLSAHNYVVEVSAAGRRAQADYDRVRPQVVLVDFDQPGEPILDMVQVIRSRGSVPIIVLSERNVECDVVTALALGADDYVTKPLPINELLARIRVALRHNAARDRGLGHTVRAGDVEIDAHPDHRSVRRAGRLVRLTPTEYHILRLLAAHPDKLLTYGMLLDGVWGRAQRPTPHTLHVYIGRLRKKLERDPDNPQYLITEPRAGYRLVTDPVANS